MVAVKAYKSREVVIGFVVGWIESVASFFSSRATSPW
jgi:hypothetical protein